MSAATAPEKKLTQEIRAFLTEHDADAVFENVCRIARDCYPNCVDMTLRLLDDPDTDERRWLVLDILVPESMSLDQLRQQDDTYHSRVVTEIPLQYCPLFTVSSRFVAS